MATYQSTIPDVLDALVTLFDGATAEDVLVVDGWRTIDETQPMVLVGNNADPEQPAVEATRTTADLSAKSDIESYSVACNASYWSGDTDAKAVRDRCFAILEQLDAAVRADRRLGGLVMMARLSLLDFSQGQYAQGAAAAIGFEVAIQAQTRRR